MNTIDLKNQSEEVLRKLRAVTKGSNIHDTYNHITKIQSSKRLIDEEPQERTYWKQRLAANLGNAHEFLVETARSIWLL